MFEIYTIYNWLYINVIGKLPNPKCSLRKGFRIETSIIKLDQFMHD